jgi:hypothetical protein
MFQKPFINTTNRIKHAIKNNEVIEEKLHVIAVIYNPTSQTLPVSSLPSDSSRESELRYKLFKEFQERMINDEPDVILYTVELAFGDQPFLVTNDLNCRHLQLRTNTPLWYRENLMNLGIKHLLPPDWKTVAWIDGDIEFNSLSWARDTLKILNGTCDLVHLYTHCNFLLDKFDGESPYVKNVFSSFGFNQQKEYKFKPPHPYEFLQHWHSGFAIACTRQVYESGICLKEIFPYGYSDCFLFACFNDDAFNIMINDFKNYEDELKQLKETCKEFKIGYVPGMITHHYHSTIETLDPFQLKNMMQTMKKINDIVTYDEYGVQKINSETETEYISKLDIYFQSRNKKKQVLFLDNIDRDNIELYVEYSMRRPGAPIWGPTTWIFLHTLAHNCKEHNEPDKFSELLDIIELIFRNVPCGFCKEHAIKYLEDNPLNLETVPDKMALIDYLFTFHNTVSERDHFPKFEYEKLEETYSKLSFDIIYTEFLNKYVNIGRPEEDTVNMNKIKEYFGKGLSASSLLTLKVALLPEEFDKNYEPGL